MRRSGDQEIASVRVEEIKRVGDEKTKGLGDQEIKRSREIERLSV